MKILELTLTLAGLDICNTGGWSLWRRIEWRRKIIFWWTVWAIQYGEIECIFWLTLRRSMRKKLRMRWFFEDSKVKESSFSKSNLTDPPSDFWCASFGKYRFKPFQISFFSGFYIKIMFWVRWFYSLFERMRLKRKKTMFIHTNQPLITSFYIKKYLFLPN